MKKLLLYTGALLLGLSSVALAKPEASHSIEQFKEILSGKVFAFDQPLWKVAKNVTSVTYLAPAGTDFHCYFTDYKTYPTIKHEGYQNNPKWDKWRLTKPFFSSGVLFTTNGNDTRSIPIYDEKTNVLERWYKTRRSNGWERLVVGHLQDTWPAWALEKCPDLKLPEGLKINHDQKTPDYKQNYEVFMGKPFPELLNNSLSEVAVPVNADGTDVTVDDVITKLEETGAQMLPVSKGQWLSYNSEWGSFWLSNDRENIKHYGYLEPTDNSIAINWQNNEFSQTPENLDLSEIWTVANAKPDGFHNARKFINWLTNAPYTIPNGIKVTHDSDGSGTAVFADGEVELFTWELKGSVYTLYDVGNTPVLVKDYRKNIKDLGRIYPQDLSE